MLLVGSYPTPFLGIYFSMQQILTINLGILKKGKGMRLQVKRKVRHPPITRNMAQITRWPLRGLGLRVSTYFAVVLEAICHTYIHILYLYVYIYI